MTTAGNGGFRRKLGGLGAWITHTSIWIGLLCALPIVVFCLLHPWTELPNAWWTIGPPFVVMGVYVAIALHEAFALCVRCMEDVPADAAIRATREGGWDRRWLRFFHWNFMVWLGLVFVVPALISITGLQGLDCAFSLEALALVASWRYHRLLRPWCPFCNKGRGWGGGEAERVPDPDPSMTKELT